MITLHYLNDSRAIRVLWMLEELGIDFELKKYERNSDKSAPKALKQANDTGKSPYLIDGAVKLAESGAILEYLQAKYDPDDQFSYERGSDCWVDQVFWLHYAEASIMPPLVVALIFNMIDQKAPFPVTMLTQKIGDQVRGRFVTPSIKSSAKLIEEALGKHDWIAGDKLTIADFQLAYGAQALLSRGKLDMPNLKKWLNRVQSRPAYQRSIEKGGQVNMPG